MSLNKSISSSVYRFGNLTSGSHRKIIDLVGKDKKILDVGCNKGYLSVKFRENGCYVVGIETDLESAGIAKNSCNEIIIGDVDQIDKLSYPDDYFDAMVFADILEHLKNPEEVLLRLKRYLNPAGLVIASSPNIARMDIRLRLLFGKFDYEETGILDRTHLRFFALSTAKKIFQDTGYKVLYTDYTGAVYNFLRILPTFFAFQFIIIAKKI